MEKSAFKNLTAKNRVLWNCTTDTHYFMLKNFHRFGILALAYSRPPRWLHEKRQKGTTSEKRNRYFDAKEFNKLDRIPQCAALRRHQCLVVKRLATIYYEQGKMEQALGFLYGQSHWTKMTPASG